MLLKSDTHDTDIAKNRGTSYGLLGSSKSETTSISLTDLRQDHKLLEKKRQEMQEQRSRLVPDKDDAMNVVIQELVETTQKIICVNGIDIKLARSSDAKMTRAVLRAMDEADASAHNDQLSKSCR